MKLEDELIISIDHQSQSQDQTMSAFSRRLDVKVFGQVLSQVIS
jgi:hypothetical protein